MVNRMEEWYWGTPVITRNFLTMLVGTSLLVTFEVVTPFHLYLNFFNVVYNMEIWRVLTAFVFLDKFGINVVFYVYFFYVYSQRLEEHNFHRRSGDFLMMLIFGMSVMLLVSFIPFYTNVTFLSYFELPFYTSSLMTMIMYVWSRVNPYEKLRLYGMFVVPANWLPYVMLGISYLFHMNPSQDILGILVGHLYFFSNYVLNKKYKIQLIKTPFFVQAYFNDNFDADEGGNEDEEIILLDDNYENEDDD